MDTPAEAIDVLVRRYIDDERVHPDGSPWVVLNMIASLDGAIAVEGRSGGLGGPADRAVFATMRGLADVIFVAAGTARDERYGPPTVPDPLVELRRRRGQAPRPTIAVVSRRLDLDPSAALFADATSRPTVLTVEDAPSAARRTLADVADVTTLGARDVDLRSALAYVADRHGPLVLVEGGPSLNGQLAAEDLLDEVCLTLSPLLVGGLGGRLVTGGILHPPRPFEVDRVAVVGGLVFGRYLRRR